MSKRFVLLFCVFCFLTVWFTIIGVAYFKIIGSTFRIQDFITRGSHYGSLVMDVTEYDLNRFSLPSVQTTAVMPHTSPTFTLTAAVTIVIKSMGKYRPRSVIRLYDSIRKFYPAISVIVGDDTTDASFMTLAMKKDRDLKFVELPTDCGLAAGRNILVDTVSTKYFLLLDDDYIFLPTTSLETMHGVLEKNPWIQLVGGGIIQNGTRLSYRLRVEQNVEEGLIQFLQDEQKYLDESSMCYCSDTTFNFFMAKTSVISKIKWNFKLKVGEHEPFFLALRIHNVSVVECQSITILHDTTKSANYLSHSHRFQLFKYAYAICDQFRGIKVMRSVYWSVVCDHRLYCDRYEGKVSCRSMYSPYKVFTRLAYPQHYLERFKLRSLRTYSKPYKELEVSCNIFVAVITTVRNSHVHKYLRKYIRDATNIGGMKIGYKFFVAKSEAKSIIHQQDVVALDVDDGYLLLATKVLAAMQWISYNVNADYIIKSDDDVYLNFRNIVKILQAKRVPKSRLITGQVNRWGSPVTRMPWHKWYLPVAQYGEEYFPTYTNGPAYIVSHDVATYLGTKLSVVRRHPFYIEDALISILLSQIDVFPQVFFPHGFIANGWTITSDFSRVYAIHPVKHPSLSFRLLQTEGNDKARIAKFYEIEKSSFKTHKLLNKQLDELNGRGLYAFNRHIQWSDDVEASVIETVTGLLPYQCKSRCQSKAKCKAWEWCGCRASKGCQGCYLFNKEARVEVGNKAWYACGNKRDLCIDVYLSKWDMTCSKPAPSKSVSNYFNFVLSASPKMCGSTQEAIQGVSATYFLSEVGDLHQNYFMDITLSSISKLHPKRFNYRRPQNIKRYLRSHGATQDYFSGDRVFARNLRLKVSLITLFKQLLNNGKPGETYLVLEDYTYTSLYLKESLKCVMAAVPSDWDTIRLDCTKLTPTIRRVSIKENIFRTISNGSSSVRPATKFRFCGGITAMLVKYDSLNKILALFDYSSIGPDCLLATTKMSNYCVNWGLVKKTKEIDVVINS